MSTGCETMIALPGKPDRHGIRPHGAINAKEIGSGKRLFPDERDGVALKLEDAQTFSAGVLNLTYQPAGA